MTDPADDLRYLIAGLRSTAPTGRLVDVAREALADLARDAPPEVLAALLDVALRIAEHTGPCDE